MGRAIVQMAPGFGEQEGQKTAEQNRSGLDRVRAQGKMLGRR